MLYALFLLLTPTTLAQPQPNPAQAAATAEDHRDMMRQLGIRALRPAPSGNPQAPNQPNYDESKANPFPDWPEILTSKNGHKTARPEFYAKERPAQIREEFAREVYGRIPEKTPKVTWTIVRQSHDKIGSTPVLARELKGRVDNSRHPAIEVNIQMVVVTPANAKRRVPLMILFTRPSFPSDPVPEAFARFAAQRGPDPPATQQLIEAGWGYAQLLPSSIQADNGAGLTQGVIGLVNKGKRRKPEHWGALMAWAWGASRALDYLTTDNTIDYKRVGIEGVS
ncbi:MAG: hypothetical protein JNL62_20575, partial [Bryobacterales bacterium]|nr:hypothetical protein [Bryobacterales bacterium]